MEVTMESLEQLLDTKLEPINTKLAAVEETLSHHTSVLHSHTSILDALSKDVKTLLDDKTVTAHRVERIEQWAQPVGEKLGVKLEL
jgi:hypothetical protein